MSIEIVIKVDGVEYEFVPKQPEVAAPVATSSSDGSEVASVEVTDTAAPTEATDTQVETSPSA